MRELKPHELMILELFVRWKLEGTQWLGVQDGVIRESYRATTTPEELDAMRTRGFTVLDLEDEKDMEAIIGALATTMERIVDGAEGIIAKQFARGLA